MSETPKRLTVTCPCCQATLTLDPESGLVVHHDRKKVEYSFEEAMEREKVRKSKADELFEKAFDAEKERHDLMEKKFREALKSKDELADPTRPFDLD